MTLAQFDLKFKTKDERMRRIRCEKEYFALATEADYDLYKFARLAKLSLRQLERDFNRDLRMSPSVWLNKQRILVAALRIEKGDDLKAIAIDLKFKQLSHFCRLFKRFFQMTASEYLHSRPSPPQYLKR